MERRFIAIGTAAVLMAQGCYTGLDSVPDGGPFGMPLDDTGDEPDEPEVELQCRPPDARIWKLTPRQYDASLERALPGAAGAGLLDTGLDERSFSNEAGHNDLPLGTVRTMFQHAEAEAQRVVADPGVLAPCLAAADLEDAACVEEAMTELMTRAFRRPPSEEQIEGLTDYVYERAAVDGPSQALGQAVQAVLGSPHFSFRTELGAPDDEAETFELDSYEIASALSYFLLDGPPDALLLEAAAAGTLGSPELRATHARRLLAQIEATRGLQEFFTDYTRTRDVGQMQLDSAKYPEFEQRGLAEQFARELHEFVSYVLAEDDARLETLLTASYSVVSPTLAEFYGVEAPSEPWGRVELPPDQRAGLVTNPALLLRGSRPEHGDPILRGVYIRKRMLCQAIPEVPGDIPPIPETADGTAREILSQHNEDPYCQQCHRLMDPLGLPLEHYDASGQFRMTDEGRTIDPSGEIHGLGPEADVIVAVDDAIDMAHTLAGRPEVADCFVRSVFAYAYGRLPSEGDACELARLQQGFEDSDGDIVELVVDIVSADHFITRRRAQ